jgi:hypothetical protein
LYPAAHFLLFEGCPDFRSDGRPGSSGQFRFHPETTSMKLEKITLVAATAAYAGYLIQQAIRTRAERLYRLAAGESPYERTHPKPRILKQA